MTIPAPRERVDGGRWPTLVKSASLHGVTPNLEDYGAARREFTWTRARWMLDGLPGNAGLNIAHEAVDRHAVGAQAAQVALRFIARDGRRRDYTFTDLHHQTNRVANALRRLGVGKGDVVVTLAGRIPELYLTALGALKQRAIFSPFFSAFGPEPIDARLTIARARVLVTTAALYRRKIEPQRASLPHLEHILIVGDGDETTSIPGTHDFRALLADAGRALHDPAHRSAGPRAAPLHERHHGPAEGRAARPRGGGGASRHRRATRSTCIRTRCSGARPIRAGSPARPTASSRRSPTASRASSTRATSTRTAGTASSATSASAVWYTAPTAIRMMMKYGSAPRARARPPRAALSRQRRRAAQSRGGDVGRRGVRPAVPRQLVADGDRRHHDRQLRVDGHPPGSMGTPMPGIEAAIVRRNEDGSVHVVTEPGVEGELALVPGWPSMFRGYLGDEARYQKCFAGGYYLTGDLARRDADGYFWFVGRADDVIKSSGHLIGPFEVESVLLEHSGGRRGRRDRQARSRRVRDREGVRRPEAGPRAHRRAARRSCSASPASGSARPWRRRRSPSSTRCPGHARARSCAGC